MGSRDLFSDVEVRDWTLLVRASSGPSSYRHYRRISKDLAKFLQKTNTRIILSAGAAVNYLILYNNTNTTQSGWQLTRSNINFVITETKSLLDWQNDQFGDKGKLLFFVTHKGFMPVTMHQKVYLWCIGCTGCPEKIQQ